MFTTKQELFDLLESQNKRMQELETIVQNLTSETETIEEEEKTEPIEETNDQETADEIDKFLGL